MASHYEAPIRNPLITGNKTKKDVLIFGCNNHPTDYDDIGICGRPSWAGTQTQWGKLGPPDH